MNTKIAALLFAIGVGSAASVSAFQQNTAQCAQVCLQLHRACLAAGVGTDQCRLELGECRDRCGI